MSELPESLPMLVLHAFLELVTARIAEETGVTDVRWDDDMGVDRSTSCCVWDFMDIYWNYRVGKIAVRGWDEHEGKETHHALENPDVINDIAARAIIIAERLHISRAAASGRPNFYS